MVLENVLLFSPNKTIKRKSPQLRQNRSTSRTALRPRPARTKRTAKSRGPDQLRTIWVTIGRAWIRSRRASRVLVLDCARTKGSVKEQYEIHHTTSRSTPRFEM